MLDFSPSIESPIRTEKKTLVIESRQFQVCTTNVTETRRRRKTTLVYAHHDGEMLHITFVDPDEKKVIRQEN